MHVLISDDDASTRFVIKRLLTQHLRCTTTECDDGVETLRQLDEGSVDLVVLDVEMPFVDGVEVLAAIRSSPRLKGLPVLMLSKERREDIIVRLVRLGIEGYILKPPRTEKFLAALERVCGGRDDAQGIRFAPDSPALLIDGNVDYRHFFVAHAGLFGPTVEAASGAAALAQFRQSPSRLVFIGAELGVVGAELLVPKLRAMAGAQPLRIVGIVGEEESADGRGFDDVIVRSMVPGKLSAALRSFAEVPTAPTAVTRSGGSAIGVLGAVTGLTGDLTQEITSAARQVFGMMLDAEIEVVDAAPSVDPMIAAVSEITIQRRYAIELGVRSTVASMTAIAGRMLGMETAHVGVEDYLSTCSELANLLSGRMHAHLEERSVASECALPVIEREPTAWDSAAIGADGVVLRFKLVAIDAEVTVSVRASQLSDVAVEPVAPAEVAVEPAAAL